MSSLTLIGNPTEIPNITKAITKLKIFNIMNCRALFPSWLMVSCWKIKEFTLAAAHTRKRISKTEKSTKLDKKPLSFPISANIGNVLYFIFGWKGQECMVTLHGIIVSPVVVLCRKCITVTTKKKHKHTHFNCVLFGDRFVSWQIRYFQATEYKWLLASHAGSLLYWYNGETLSLVQCKKQCGVEWSYVVGVVVVVVFFLSTCGALNGGDVLSTLVDWLDV